MKMIKVGLTGGIGSGKTTAANMFAELGTPIIDADAIAHEITKLNNPVLKKIINRFGPDILNSDGSLDRRKLAYIIFNNVTERKWLEKIMHPIIREKMRQQIATINAPYCILVIPLLVESNRIDFIDRILVIDVPTKLQIQRTHVRDKTMAKAIKKIMQSQSSRKNRLAIADDIIVNDGDLNQLREKVLKFHRFYLKLEKSKKE